MIAVVDYGIGNLRSAEKALQHVGADASLVASPSGIEGASAIVLPGVGSFGRCADALETGGWVEPITAAVEAGTPFLGICVGFQLLYERSEESPGHRGLGLLEGSVTRLAGDVKLPQMQWNRLDVSKPNDLLDETPEHWMYFVHSYAPAVGRDTVATCDYGSTISAAVQRGSLCGVQFHPEKSGAEGLEMLRRFTQMAMA